MIFFWKRILLESNFLNFISMYFCSVNNCIIVNQWIHLLLKRIGKSNVSKMKTQYKRACLRATWIKLMAFSSLHQISNLQLMFGLFLDTSLSRTGDFEYLQATTDAPLIPNMFHVAEIQRWMKLLVRSFRCSVAELLFLRLAISRFVPAKWIGYSFIFWAI